MTRLVFPCLFFVTSFFLSASGSMASEPLRWKFEVGQKFNYHMVQNMEMEMTAGPAGAMKTTVRQVMDMTWDVQGVNEEGEAVILQTFDQIQMSMKGMPGQGLEYDSSSEEPPAGMAAMIAPLFKAMTMEPFELTMTARGEVRDVKVPQKVLDAIKNSPGAAMMGEMATAEGFQKMIMQGALALPEETPVPGQEWTTAIEINNPMAGKQTVETTYRYGGTKEVDGITYDLFQPTIKMDFAGNAAMKMNVKDQQSSGEILFNREAGRLHSTNLMQDATMEIVVAGQTIEQKIHQEVEVLVTPVTEEAAAAAIEEAAVEEEPATVGSGAP